MAIGQSTRYDLDRDVQTLDAMASRLTPYIYEDELYGLMPGDLAKLTVGGLLMRLNRLSAISGQLAPKQQAVVRSAQEKFDKVRHDWTVALEGKIEREWPARMTALSQFVNECADQPQACLENYPGEVEKRVMLQVLYDEAVQRNMQTDQMKSGLTAMDNKLHRYVESGGFLWDARLQPAYPADKYWFLYAK